MNSTFTVGQAYGALPQFKHYPKILIEGPRGTSKSRSILGWFLSLLLMHAGSRLLICRQFRTDLTKTILATLEEEVFPAFGLPVPGGAHRSGRSEYLLPNGSVIWPAGIDTGIGILSMGITYAYAAEVVEMAEETVTNIAGGLRWLRSPERPTLPEHSQLIMDCNPDAPAHWANVKAEPIPQALRFVKTRQDYMNLQRYNYAPAKDPVNRWKRIVTKHQDNPGYWNHRAWDYWPLGRSYVTQQLEGYTGHKRERWLHGLWKAAEGAVFTEFDEDIHGKTPFRVPGTIGYDGKLPPADEVAWPIYVFYDPGIDHPTGISWVAIGPNGRHYVIDELKDSGKTAMEWMDLLKRRNERFGRKVLQYFGDPHGAFQRSPGGVETIAEQIRKAHGICFVKWPGAGQRDMKEAMVEKMKGMLKNPMNDGRPAFQVFTSCAYTKHEFQAWRYKRNERGEQLKGDDQYEDANNDLLDGLLGCVAMNLSPAGQRMTRARHDDEPARPLERPRVVVSSPRRRPPSRDPLRGMRMKVRM